MLSADPKSDPNRIRSGCPNRRSETDSYERTNGRTDEEANYGRNSWQVMQRVCAYRGMAADGLTERLADAAAKRVAS